jgi:hypothetical protein
MKNVGTMRRPGWFTLEEATEFLSQKTFQTSFSDLKPSSRRSKDVCDLLRTALLTDKVEAYVTRNGRQSRLQLSDMLPTPFRIVRSPLGVQIARYPESLCGLILRTSDLQVAVAEALPVEKAIFPTQAEKNNEFKAWLIEEMKADRRRPKREFQDYAERTFGVAASAFRLIWKAAIKETGKRDWSNPGRPKSN